MSAAPPVARPHRTIRLTVEYDGEGLCGWQRQENGPTVQQHIEEALAAMHSEPTIVFGASRTDAGVHALGQVCHFHTTSRIPLQGYKLGLNTSLPRQIAIAQADEVANSFHARFDSIGKHYRYQIWNRGEPSPFHRRTAWHCKKNLDTPPMQEAAQHLCGEHDFSAFRSVGCSAKSPVRRINRVVVARTLDLITIDIWGNAFLRNMVRIIAGTLVECGQGKRTPKSVARALQTKSRNDAGTTAPAHGLTLVEVLY